MPELEEFKGTFTYFDKNLVVEKFYKYELASGENSHDVYNFLKGIYPDRMSNRP